MQGGDESRIGGEIESDPEVWAWHSEELGACARPTHSERSSIDRLLPSSCGSSSSSISSSSRFCVVRK